MRYRAEHETPPLFPATTVPSFLLGAESRQAPDREEREGAQFMGRPVNPFLHGLKIESDELTCWVLFLWKLPFFFFSF